MDTATTARGSVQRYLKLDPDAAQILDAAAPSVNKRGFFISMLLYEWAARHAERQRLIAALQDGEGEGEGEDRQV